ncbi:unnamed protein product, partial [Mesorhabditis spiculigera]
MERSFDDNYCTIQLRDCNCGEKEQITYERPNYDQQSYSPPAPPKDTYAIPSEDLYATQEPTYPTPPPTYDIKPYKKAYSRPDRRKGYKIRTTRSPYQYTTPYYRRPKTSRQPAIEPYRPPGYSAAIQRPINEANDEPEYFDKPLRRKVPLAPGHDLNVASMVQFTISRPRPDCVELIIQRPRNTNEDASFNNQLFRYFSTLVNITNYSPEQVMIYRDADHVQCNIGDVSGKHRTRRPPKMVEFTTTTDYPETTREYTPEMTREWFPETTTSEYFRPYTLQRSALPRSKGYDYEGKVALDHEYTIEFECAVPFQVYRPSRWEITITLGADGDSTPKSFKNARFGRYNIDCINYSDKDVDISQMGTRATCMRRRLFNLEDGRSFEILGTGEWEVEDQGQIFIITIGHAPVNGRPLTKSHSEFTFGSYTIMIDNYTPRYFSLEQVNSRLQALIGLNQRRK